MSEYIMSDLPKTWIIDLDGTIFKHNGYKTDGFDSILPGVKEYMSKIPREDVIIILTARTTEYEKITIEYLNKYNIRFDKILFNMPFGERIVINDRKPSGLDTAYAVNINRDEFDVPDVIRKL